MNPHDVFSMFFGGGGSDFGGSHHGFSGGNSGHRVVFNFGDGGHGFSSGGGRQSQRRGENPFGFFFN